MCVDIDGGVIGVGIVIVFNRCILLASIVGGPQEKCHLFQIASGLILSIPIHSNTCQCDPCKVLEKKMTPFLPMNHPKSVFFGSSDWASD